MLPERTWKTCTPLLHTLEYVTFSTAPAEQHGDCPSQQPCRSFTSSEPETACKKARGCSLITVAEREWAHTRLSEEPTPASPGE